MKTALVTGATSGIGLAVCKQLVNCGWCVIAVGRDDNRIAAAQQELANSAEQGGSAVFFKADLSKIDGVKHCGALAAGYIDEHCGGRLDALINNAGCVCSSYMETSDKIERQFALNHLSGFMLTHLLLGRLTAAYGRVIFTSSASHRLMRIHWKDLMYQKRYRPLMAYKQSKLCNVLCAMWLRSNFGGNGVSFYCVDPGLVRTEIGLKDTGGIVKFVWRLRMRQGTDSAVPARTYTYLLSAEQPHKGLYYYNCRRARINRAATAAAAERLCNLSMQLCGIDKYGAVDFTAKYEQ